MADMTLEEALAAAEVDTELITPVDDVLMIDPETRLINVPASEENFGVFRDRNTARKHFKCPRIVQDNIDLSKCYLFVNYVSSSGKPGQYWCEDVESTADGNYITFSWKITGNVFDVNKDATIYFAVQAKKIDGDNVFNTRKAQGKSYETVDATEQITEEYADVILQIIARLETLEDNPVPEETIATAVAEYLATHPIEETDPTVPAWAKQPQKPSYTAEDVGALPDTVKALPNPNKLSIEVNGATVEYDGSGAVTVTIPDANTERIEKASTDTVVELQPNKLYIFPEMSTLTYTLAAGETNVANEYHFVFQSGATPTEVVHPAGVNVGSLTIEANKIYEISVLENNLTGMSWAVSA